MRHADFNVFLSRKLMPAGYSFASANYDKYQVIYVQNGELKLTVENRDHVLTPGWLTFLRRESAFTLSSDSGYSGLGLIMEGSELSEFAGETRAVMADSQTRTTAELIDHYLLKPDMDSRRIIRSLSYAFISQAMELEKRHIMSGKENWSEIAKAVLDVSLGTGVSAKQALAHIPLCYRQLSRLFSAAYGMSPKQYQVSARIEEAKRMLNGSGLNITEVALELGFASSQHFATQFKKVAGMTPREFIAG